jgi:hypothetical protein
VFGVLELGKRLNAHSYPGEVKQVDPAVERIGDQADFAIARQILVKKQGRGQDPGD